MNHIQHPTEGAKSSTEDRDQWASQRDTSGFNFGREDLLMQASGRKGLPAGTDKRGAHVTPKTATKKVEEETEF